MIGSLFNWEETAPDRYLVDHLAGVLDLPEPLARTLVNRGITTAVAAERFLNPQQDDMHDPGLFRDMEKAVGRIVSALKDHQRILILGDYDVDGITGTALLISFLRGRGGHVNYYIPNRIKEGYGLSVDVVEKAHKAKYDLIITVDTGISAIEEARAATALGMDVIVTDHHEPHDDTPDVFAILNPKLADATYPFRDLAGVGVAFKLALALAEYLGMDHEEVMNEYIELAALGTVADLAPLLDENRYMVRRGLAGMTRSRNPGLYSLLKVSHIKEEDRMDTMHVGFRLAPRINAAGRLWKPRAGVELFLETNPDKARLLAEKLDEHNRLRVHEEAKILESALKRLEESGDPGKDGVIFLHDDKWHVGVIGIVASKIMERYHRPVLLATESQRPVDAQNPHPERGRIFQGSARSFREFDLYAGLSECSDILLSYGGHKLAAGLKIYEKDIPELKRRLGELASGAVGGGDFRRSITLDADVSLSSITLDLARKFRSLEPCGVGNRRPVLRARAATVLKSYSCGPDGGVLKLKLGQGNAVRDAVGFGKSEIFDPEKLYGRQVDVVFDLQEDNYAGRKKVGLKIIDLKENL